MRHVVLGANTNIGGLCIKLLITIGENIRIVAVTTGGQLSPDIPLDQIEVVRGSILEPLQLYNILEKDDLVYNAQVYFEEEKDLEELELVNHLGLVNLLGVASLIQVKKIVSLLPQQIGWTLPDVVTENSTQMNPDMYQEVTIRILDMLRRYWRRRPYGWNSRNIRAWAKQNIKKPKYPITYYPDEELGYSEEDASVPTEQIEQEFEDGDIPIKPPDLNLEPESPVDEGKEVVTKAAINEIDEKTIDEDSNTTELEDVSDSEEKKEDSLSDEELEIKTDTDEVSEANEDVSDSEGEKEDNLLDGEPEIKTDTDEISEINEESEEIEKELSERELFWKRQREEAQRREIARETIEEELAKVRGEREIREEKERELRRREFHRVPVVIARYGRIFGAYDRNFTLQLCDAVKRGSITTIGPMDKQISWITPVDIGRSMIILGDKSVPQGQYFLNSFTASPREIMDQLDMINASELKITERDINRELKLLRIRNYFAKFGIGSAKNKHELLKYNTRQVFSDAKARKRWKWHPRFTFIKATEDAYQWYFEVIVPEKYPLKSL